MTVTTFQSRGQILRHLEQLPEAAALPEDTEPDGFPSVPEGTRLPITRRVFWHCFEFLPPRLDGSDWYIAGEGDGRLYYFWTSGPNYFAAYMTQELSDLFRELRRQRPQRPA